MKEEKRIDKENPLSCEEIEMLRTGVKVSVPTQKKKKPKTQKLRKFAKENTLLFALLSAVCVLLLAVLIIAAAFIIKDIADRPNTSDYTIYFGKTEQTVKYKDTVKDGIVYIDMRDVAEFGGLAISGSETRVKFTASDDHYVRFTNDDDLATVNGSTVQMKAKATVTKDSCVIPLDFLMSALEFGIKITHDSENNKIYFGRQVYSVNDELIPTEIRFTTSGFTVIESQKPKPEFEYSIDISKYIASIDPANAEEYLVLVNKSHPLGEKYSPADLVKLTECRTSREMELRLDAANALYAMMQAMKKDAPATADTFVTSAFRSYSYQVTLYNKYVNEFVSAGLTESDARAEASKFSARPGESEHQSGLCVDFMTDTMSDLDESFESTAAFRWLSENAHKFGFILRYPKDKEDITEYSYEPWHYRFVGREAATEIYSRGLCLEEYLD